MTSRPLRILLLCLLVLALPAQGMAAVSMQVAVALAAESHTGHATNMSFEHCAQPCGKAEVAHDHAAPGHASCSLCVFCVGVVTLSAALPSLAIPPGSHRPGALLQRFVGHIADTPDRPPRMLIG